MRWPTREPSTHTRAVVQVTPGTSPQPEDRFGFESKGWAAYVSMSEMARHGIGWHEIDSACESIDSARRAIGEGMLLGSPKAVRAYLGLDGFE